MEKDLNKAKFSHKHTYPKYDSYFLFYLNINSVHIWENFEINEEKFELLAFSNAKLVQRTEMSQ